MSVRKACPSQTSAQLLASPKLASCSRPLDANARQCIRGQEAPARCRSRAVPVPRPRPKHMQSKTGLCQAVAGSGSEATVASVAASSSLNATLAKAMGYFVLAGASVRSIPQIIRIEKTQSVQGLSESANLFEFIAYSIMLAYNFRLGYAFNTYGEIAACWLQDIILACLIVKYSRKPGRREYVAVAAFCLAFWSMMSGACNMQILTYLQASTIGIISLGGRVPQIMMNVRNGHSGQLSAITCGMNTCGCFARMFTTLVLTQDMLNFAGTALQAVLNGILFWQCVKTSRLPESKKAELKIESTFRPEGHPVPSPTPKWT